MARMLAACQTRAIVARLIVTFRLRLLLLLPLAMLAPVSAAHADDAQLALVRKALDAAEQTADEASDDPPQLRASLLYPYVLGQRLLTAVRLQPGPGTDAGVAAFLADPEHAALPVADSLHRAWLLSLAEREAWADFVVHDRTDDTTVALACARYQARIHTEPASRVAAELREIWARSPQMPQGCVAPFDWLEAQGVLDAATIERRTRKALTDGNTALADYLIRKLPAARAAPLAQWSRLLRNPARELAALTAAKTVAAGVEPAALRAGFDKLSRRDPRRAQSLLADLHSLTDDETYARLQRSLALGLAWSREPAALAAFDALEPGQIDDDVAAWAVRSALWQGNADAALRWLDALSSTEADTARWRYWRARAQQLRGQKAQARSGYAPLAQENGYYAVLAAWRLGEAYRAQPQPFIDDPDVQARLLAEPAIQRARDLFLLDRKVWANIEWQRALKDRSADEQLQAARLASRWGWHLQAVILLNRHDALDRFELSYPDPYANDIRHSAARSALPPEWVYALMRQESLFDPRAVSPSNAYGLLQLLLPTARQTAKKIGLPRPDVDDLMQPSINLPLGAAYLGQMRERFDGQFAPAVAAYNAGPNAVARWLPPRPLDADRWIENVPYNETRNYVQRVTWHIAAHRWPKPLSTTVLDDWLAPVTAPAK